MEWCACMGRWKCRWRDVGVGREIVQEAEYRRSKGGSGGIGGRGGVKIRLDIHFLTLFESYSYWLIARSVSCRGVIRIVVVVRNSGGCSDSGWRWEWWWG